MAVQLQTPYIKYLANGTTKSFPLEFDCENYDHLIVLVDDLEPVVGAWSLNGGAVVFTVAPGVNKKITIQRNSESTDADDDMFSFAVTGITTGRWKLIIVLNTLNAPKVVVKVD